MSFSLYRPTGQRLDPVTDLRRHLSDARRHLLGLELACASIRRVCSAPLDVVDLADHGRVDAAWPDALERRA